MLKVTMLMKGENKLAFSRMPRNAKMQKILQKTIGFYLLRVHF